MVSKAKLARLSVCLLIGILCQQLLSFMVELIEENHIAEQHQEVAGKVAVFNARIAQQLNYAFNSNNILAQSLKRTSHYDRDFVEQNREKVEQWSEYTAELIPIFKTIGLSRRYIVEYVYPEEGNTGALGLDYREHEEQWPAVERSVKTRKAVVSGPLKLVQGGSGIVTRMPIFSGKDQSGEFLAIITLILNFEELLKHAGLESLQEELKIAIRGYDGLGSKGKVIFGDHHLFHGHHVWPVQFEGGSWEVAAEPLSGWNGLSSYFFLLYPLVFIVSVAIALMSYTTITAYSGRISEMLAFNRVLEDKVKVRTEELLEAKERAEQASQSKTEFLTIMTHELRTPLNSVIGHAQLMETTELGAESSGYLKKLLFSANNLLALINTILSYSKIESGKFELKKEVFNPSELVNQIYHVFESLATEKGIALTTKIENNTPANVFADREKITQILNNLCGNAVKFTESGEIVLSLSVVDEHDAQDSDTRLRFAVRDTGIGISEKYQESLFEPFSAADASLSRNYEGTGLGLSICKKLAELMGGKIMVESQPKQGSYFYFDLPVEIHETKNLTDRPSDIQQVINEARQHLCNKTVLLAEDNEFNKSLVVALLNKVDANVLWARNGIEAIALLEERAVDIILMDLQMPNMDGLEATRVIRQQPKTSTIPIIALTANAMDEDQKKALALGMNDFVAKPIDIAALFRAMCRCVT